MRIDDATLLITGANRGLGQALVEDALRRGAKRVYAGARRLVTHPDDRVTPLRLDVTDEAQIRAAVESVESLDILINNAGVSGVGACLADRRCAEISSRDAGAAGSAAAHESNGSSRSSRVPSPGRLCSRNVPPMASTRSFRPTRPEPCLGSAPPTPSSLTESRRS